MRKSIFLFFLLFSSAVPATQAVLLVSLGMPDQALQAYFEQGKRYGIPLVIRGLYHNPEKPEKGEERGSLGETVTRMKSLFSDFSAADPANKGGVSIDPLLFRAFDIKAVPALVIYEEDLACIQRSEHVSDAVCPANQFEVMSGNLPLKKLLSIIADRSNQPTVAAFAKALLEKGEVTE